MNTIDGLKKLPSIINDLMNQRDSIQSAIDGCYKPFIDIVNEVLINGIHKGYTYIDEGSFGFDDFGFYFSLKYSRSEDIEGSYVFPLDAFISADTLWKYICDEKEKKEKAEIAKREHNKRMAQTHLEESERETYEKLKKKFEGT